MLIFSDPVVESDIINESIKWMQSNAEPSSKVWAHMIETFKFRSSWIHGSEPPRIHEILEKFPRFSDSDGFQWVKNLHFLLYFVCVFSPLSVFWPPKMFIL